MATVTGFIKLGFKVKEPVTYDLFKVEESSKKSLIEMFQKQMSTLKDQIQHLEEEITTVKLGMIPTVMKVEEKSEKKIKCEKTKKKLAESVNKPIHLGGKKNLSTTKIDPIIIPPQNENPSSSSSENSSLIISTLRTLSTQIEILNEGMTTVFKSLGEVFDGLMEKKRANEGVNVGKLNEKKSNVKMVRWANVEDSESDDGSDDGSDEGELKIREGMNYNPYIDENLAYPVFVKSKPKHKKIKMSTINDKTSDEITSLKQELMKLQQQKKEEESRRSILTEEEKNLTRE